MSGSSGAGGEEERKVREFMKEKEEELRRSCQINKNPEGNRSFKCTAVDFTQQIATTMRS